MGRGKIPIRRIENTNNRQMTFSKRKAGLLKKAMEISVLCDAKAAVLIFSSAGRIEEFCSPQAKLDQVLHHYQHQSGNKLWEAKHEDLSQEVERIKKENNAMDIRLRHMEGEDLSSLTYLELIELESMLEDGLSSIRKQQIMCLDIHEKKGDILEEVKRNLIYDLQMKMDGRVREPENNGSERDSPFPFQVQPNQPNLRQQK